MILWSSFCHLYFNTRTLQHRATDFCKLHTAFSFRSHAKIAGCECVKQILWRFYFNRNFLFESQTICVLDWKIYQKALAKFWKKKWIFQKSEILRSKMERLHCQILSRLVKSKISACPFFSSRKRNMPQTRRKTYDSPEASLVRFCNVYFFSSLASSTRRIRPQKRARISVHVSRQFDAVHQAVETENFVVNLALRNAIWRKTERRRRSSIVARLERRARQNKENNNGERKGKWEDRRREEESRSFVPSPLDRSEDERKREPGTCGAPLALLRQRVIARPFLRSSQRP